MCFVSGKKLQMLGILLLLVVSVFIYSVIAREGLEHSKRKRDENSHLLQSIEDLYVPMNITNDLLGYEDYFNLLDDESRDQIEIISPNFRTTHKMEDPEEMSWFGKVGHWFSARFGGEDVERSIGKRPVPANCVPEMECVPLKLADESDSKDATIVVFPHCTRVKRCSGCCNNNLVSCQPVKTNQIIFEIFKSRFLNGGKLKFMNKELVEVEEHTKCKCDCKKKESDCSRLQRYSKAQCLCICTNLEDKKKCLAGDVEKMWDPHSCTCRCRETKDCSTGTYFNANTCSCQELIYS